MTKCSLTHLLQQETTLSVESFGWNNISTPKEALLLLAAAGVGDAHGQWSISFFLFGGEEKNSDEGGGPLATHRGPKAGHV